MEDKTKLFLDLDDTVLMSSQAVINILNKRNGTNKTFADLKDWRYKSIDHNISTEDALAIYASKEFFETVKVTPTFEQFYKEHEDEYEFIFVSKGVPDNLRYKKEFIATHFPKARFEPCILLKEGNFDKSHIDMRGGIQVDDRVDCLTGTNASVKILLTNGKDFKWNRSNCTVNEYYIVDTFEQVVQIIEFFNEHKEFLEA